MNDLLPPFRNKGTVGIVQLSGPQDRSHNSAWTKLFGSGTYFLSNRHQPLNRISYLLCGIEQMLVIQMCITRR